VTLVDFCNLYDTWAHPASVRSPHASGAFLAPLLAGTNRCQLRRLGGALPHRQPASHDRRATARRTSHSTCVEMTSRGSECSSEGKRALMTIRACRPRCPPGARVTVEMICRVWIPSADEFDGRGPASVFAPRRAAPSTEPRRLPPCRNPYATGGSLPRARLDRLPFTPPPWRHCSGTSPPLLPRYRCLPLT